MIIKDPLKCKQKENLSTLTSEIAEWKITARNKPLTIIGVYRPPATKGTHNSVTTFTDEFMEIVQDELISNKNIIVLGDFNIHVDDENDPEAQGFLDCMIALGLEQHVHHHTHNKLHTLDHLYAESLDGLKVSNVHTDLLISDHCAVIADLELERDDIRKSNYNNQKFETPNTRPIVY